MLRFRLLIYVHIIYRGGSRISFKKIAPSGGRSEIFWDISCEKSRFYAKKSYFFQLQREAWQFLEYFVWKITVLRQKIIFFPILGGGASPWIRPWYMSLCVYASLNSWSSLVFLVPFYNEICKQVMFWLFSLFFSWNNLHSDRSSHANPVYPDWHSHTPGLRQEPPFLHPSPQTAKIKSQYKMNSDISTNQ